MTPNLATNAPSGIVVDGSPLHDLFVSIEAIAAPATFPRWRSWAEQAARSYSEPELRRLRHWFGARLWLGRSYHVLVPLLAEPRDLQQLLRALAELPLADFLRIALTAGIVDPDAPIGAEDVMALIAAPQQAREYVKRNLRVSGQLRTQILRTLRDPEGARAELVAVLRRQAELPAFGALIEETSEERARATDALRALASGGVDALQRRVARHLRVSEFAPVILAPSVFLDGKMGTYFQEVSRSLLDGVDYEPLVFLVGTQRALDADLTASRETPHANDRRDALEQAASTFSLLSDPSRLRLIALLARRPHYGQEMALALGMSGATISHHTELLLKAGVLDIERRVHRTYFVLRAAAVAELLRGATSTLADLLARGDGSQEAGAEKAVRR